MDANAVATGHYACTTFGNFLENYDAVAGIHNFCVYTRLVETVSLVLLLKMILWCSELPSGMYCRVK
jgi:hypothetical protein